MAENSHFLSVSISEFVLDRSNLFFSQGLEWCGDSFESGYRFREQLDLLILPRCEPQVRAVLTHGAPTFEHPIVDALRRDEGASTVTPLTAAQFADLRRAVRIALDSSDWDAEDNEEWAAIAAAEGNADFFVLVEFE